MIFGPKLSVAQIVAADADQEEAARQKRIRAAWDAYFGAAPLPLTKTDLDPEGRDNTRLNLARISVDKCAFYLFGKGVEFDVAGADGERDEKASEWLANCWGAQKGGMVPLLLEFATSAGIAGDGFLRLYPASAAGMVFPRIVPLRADTLKIETSPEDVTQVVRYRIEWTGVDKSATPPTAIAYRHTIQREGDSWNIREEESYGDARRFTLTLEEPWPYPFAPIFHVKNRPCPHSVYGMSDLEGDVLDLSRAVDFVLSNINRILRAHGHPLLYVVGQELSKLDRSVGAMPYFPNPEARILSVEMQSDLSASFDQLTRLLEMYHELVSIPEIASGKVQDIGQLSGLALQILYGPLTALVETKRSFYGQMLKELCQALLTLSGSDPGPITLRSTGKPRSITLRWPQLLPTSRKEEVETALLEHELGTSRETLLTALGRDASVEEAQRAREAELGAAQQQASAEAQQAAFNRE